MPSKIMVRMSRGAAVPPVWTSVLAVIAHPDGASSGLGAVLDAFVMAGARVDVVCLTHGQTWTLDGSPGDLAALRGAEIASADDVLGQIRAQLEDVPDGALRELCQTTMATTVVDIADFCHPDGFLVFDAPDLPGYLDHASATSVALLAAETLDRPVLGWNLSETARERLRGEFGDGPAGHDAGQIDLRVTIERARQRMASRANSGLAVPGSVLRRRLELLGETESLRWLRK